MMLKVAMTAVIVATASWLAPMPAAPADPLVPLTPEEVRYLDHLHQLLPGHGDPAVSHGDGWLLEKGWYACSKKAQGFVGAPTVLLSPIITQVAYADLCPG
ncbi:hypothetical protein [Mycobacterium vicinigordonae]|uniref:DUF732 domain-containing protein n=1 Tax=Mycobacterium vicinigordonae TaxID=1719132 RepID=A0A7D6E750_9MYCO|nr:hypothetical protein [Mycobacterium vicinigordonae]QLL08702.1 hypothetical protein H0P51_07225 [Mycobacterium vicinigordonae]